MFELTALSGSKPECYAELLTQLDGLTHGEPDPIANMANAASLIFNSLPDLNWAGFYRLMGDVLVLGPFMGRPACIRIPIGKGVCGTAVAENATQLVPDVHAFPGHIACDSASRSELVVPITVGGRIIGVLDLDSPSPARFDAEDAAGCERLMALLAPRIA
ncbi:MAG TPA: GAF domain-containing protein [Pedomonas sp.]|nr:GAF domain-containing protein [Pedomonas sp.]